MDIRYLELNMIQGMCVMQNMDVIVLVLVLVKPHELLFVFQIYPLIF